MFILQNNPNKIKIDNLTVKDILNSIKESFEEVTIDMIKYARDFRYKETDIPVGDINFVRCFLSKFCNISHLNPIEVPVELQDYNVLKRNYSVEKG